MTKEITQAQKELIAYQHLADGYRLLSQMDWVEDDGENLLRYKHWNNLVEDGMKYLQRLLAQAE